VCADGMTECGC